MMSSGCWAGQAGASGDLNLQESRGAAAEWGSDQSKASFGSLRTETVFILNWTTVSSQKHKAGR